MPGAECRTTPATCFPLQVFSYWRIWLVNLRIKLISQNRFHLIIYEANEMKMLVEESRKAWEAMGKVHYGLTGKEKDSRKLRRSIYAVKDI